MLNETAARQFIEIINQSSMVIDGVEGLQIIFLINRSIGPHSDGDPSCPTVNRRIYVEYGGLIWAFVFRLDASTADTEQTHVEHFLGTFNFPVLNPPVPT